VKLTITAASYLLLGLLGVTVFVFSLVSMRKENQFGHPLKGVIWLSLAIICLCAMVLLGDHLEKARALETISRRVEAMILGF
jgi:hypothetical protein